MIKRHLNKILCQWLTATTLGLATLTAQAQTTPATAYNALADLGVAVTSSETGATGTSASSQRHRYVNGRHQRANRRTAIGLGTGWHRPRQDALGWPAVDAPTALAHLLEKQR